MAPGMRYEYNDTRVNRLALSLLRMWKRPLPDVLREEIMDPISASNSWVEIEGNRVQSVSGGGHWCGGMFTNAYDQARFGLLRLHDGSWNGKQLLSKDWVEMSKTPTALRPTYGFLNTEQAFTPVAPDSHFYHAGAGVNRIWVAPERDTVVVVRWISGDHFIGFTERMLATISS